MKRIVDQASYEKHVSQENKNLVKDFLIEQKAQEKAASTLQLKKEKKRWIVSM